MGSAQSWQGPTGRITIEAIRREVPDFDSATYYLCGPNSMVKELACALKASGIPKERVRYEKWGDYSF